MNGHALNGNALSNGDVTPPAISPNETVVVRYGERSALSRWRERYWTESYVGATSWLAVVVLIGFLILGPQFILAMTSFLPLDQLGNSGASIRAHWTVILVAFVLSIPPLIWIVRSLLRPRTLEISAEGIRKRWMAGVPGKILRWTDVGHLYVSRPAGKTDIRDYQLHFAIGKTPPRLRLRVGDLEEDEQRELVISSIERYAPELHIDGAVFDMLRPRRNLSFTEIWLEALAAPPGRARLLPLSEGVVLNTRYKIERRLGAGGQGTAYLADDLQEKKQVVLKETILPVYADLGSRKKALEDFHKEAFALESVKHPNIVKFVGSFVADHRAYLVLEYIRGVTLSALIKDGGILPPERAVEFGIQMCDILSVLHQVPLVHRDFTPDNLMVGDDGKLVLLDFAVAVSADHESTEIAGKAAYMAPEQFKGKPGTQSDIYSLGCTLFYVLTGENPEPLNECWPLLVNNDVSTALNDVVATATKYHTAQRYSDVTALKSALKNIAATP